MANATRSGLPSVTVTATGRGRRAPALTDLLAGLRPLAVTAATRVEMLPDIPTVGESVPGYEAVGCADFGRFIAAYTEKWAKVIKFAGAKIY